jgi:hypothetical protein
MPYVEKPRSFKRGAKRAPRHRRPPQKHATPEQLERLKLLQALGPNAILLTRDAALYCGISHVTWERWRVQGKTPPAYRVDGRSLGYRKGDLDAMIAASAEEPSAEMRAVLTAGEKRIREREREKHVEHAGA